MLTKFFDMKLIDKILAISGTFIVVAFAVYLIIDKKPTYHFIIPEGYSGWLTVQFEKPNAEALDKEDGVIEIFFDENGFSQTSSRLDRGWGKELYFRSVDGKKVAFDKVTDGENEKLTWIHEKLPDYRKLDSIVIALPSYLDTVLFDGTDIEMQDTTADIVRGRRLLLHFYLSERPEAFYYKPPNLPEFRKYW